MERWRATSEFAAGCQYPTPCRDFASESRSAAGMRTGFRAAGRHGADPMKGRERATRYFAEGEYLHALRLTSELVDLRAADANRIPRRRAARSRSDGEMARHLGICRGASISHALPRFRQRIALCGGDANRIPCREAARSRSDGGGIAYPKEKHPILGCFSFGGATRNRTGDEGFADLCLTAWLWRRMERITGLEPATSTLARSRSTK